MVTTVLTVPVVMPLPVIVAVIALTPGVTATSTTSTSTAAAPAPVPTSPTTATPRQGRETEAGPERRIRTSRNLGLHRLVALHGAELHFRRGAALLVGGVSRRGDCPVGDSDGEGEVDPGSHHVSALGVGHLDHQRVGQPASQHGALSVPGDGSKHGRTAR